MTFIYSRRIILAGIITIVLLSVLSGLGYAQETDTTNTPATDAQTNTVGSDRVKENVMEMIQQKRAAAMERAKTSKANFDRKLQSIKDQNKKNAVERINSALSNINTNKTNRWASALDKMSQILERIKAKVSDALNNGSDVTAVNALINAAESAIANATTAVEEQAGKEYVIEITDELTLGESVRTVVQQFKQDLRATHTQVLSARKAVINAAQGASALNSNQQTVNPDNETAN